MSVQQVPISSAAPDISARAAAAAPAPSPVRHEPTFLQVFTLVLWLTCLVVGLLGLWLQDRLTLPNLSPPKPEPPPMKAEVIDVDLAPRPIAVAIADSVSPPSAEQAPAPPDVPPAAPALPAVAAPSPAIAFELPVEGPVRIVAPARAAVAAPPKAAPRSAVQHLVLGQGSAGAQPKPEYPTEALAAHQEGTVGVQFTVAPGGRVIEAHVAQPSPWPLLNQAALRVVREEWANPQWVPGQPYLVSIVFRINEL